MGKPSKIFLNDIDLTTIDWLVDIVICLGAFGFGLLQLTLSLNLFVPDDFIRRLLGLQNVAPSMYGVLATFLTCLPLIIRRRFAWISFLVSITLWLAFEMLWGFLSISMIGPLIALFTVCFECSRTSAIISVLIFLSILFITSFASVSSSLTRLMLVQEAAIVIAVGFAGLAMNAQRAFLKQAEDKAQKELELRMSEEARAREMEKTKEAEAVSRLQLERTSIARDVHDITAHSLTAINIQASVAERSIGKDDDEAKRAIDSIKEISKTSLVEIRDLVGFLRADDASDDDKDPKKTLSDLDDLKEYLEDLGIRCDIECDRTRLRDIPLYLSVIGYGIIREAVTNIAKHSKASASSIHLTLDDDSQLIVHIVDDGVGSDPDALQSNGHGLAGIYERVESMGGSFHYANGSEKGFELDIVLPIGKH